LQEVRFGQGLRNDRRHLLTFLLLTLSHRNTKAARVLTIKCGPNCFADTRCLRPRHNHPGPRRRLQHKPMGAAHMERANSG
jgi:hypothetical protein